MRLRYECGTFASPANAEIDCTDLPGIISPTRPESRQADRILILEWEKGDICSQVLASHQRQRQPTVLRKFSQVITFTYKHIHVCKIAKNAVPFSCGRENASPCILSINAYIKTNIRKHTQRIDKINPFDTQSHAQVPLKRANFQLARV